MTSIFKYLTSQAKSVSTYTTNPLWQIVDGPYKLSQYNTTTGAFTMAPNTTYGGPHVNPDVQLQASARSPPTPRSSTRSRPEHRRRASFPRQDIPQMPEVNRLGYNYFGMPDFGD